MTEEQRTGTVSWSDDMMWIIHVLGVPRRVFASPDTFASSREKSRGVCSTEAGVDDGFMDTSALRCFVVLCGAGGDQGRGDERTGCLGWLEG